MGDGINGACGSSEGWDGVGIRCFDSRNNTADSTWSYNFPQFRSTLQRNRCKVATDLTTHTLVLMGIHDLIMFSRLRRFFFRKVTFSNKHRNTLGM